MSTATPQAIPTQVDDAPHTSGAVTTADTSASHLNRDGDVANPPIPTDNVASLRKLRLDVIKLAWPVVVEQLLVTAVGIADVAITGRLGPSALAGSGVSLQIMFIAFSALSAFGIGTTVVVAQATGARTPAVAGNALRQGMVLGTIFSLLLTCVGWLITEPLIALAGGTGDVAEAGVTFLTVGLVGMVPLTLQFAIGGAMRGAGDSRTPMICGALVNVVNIAAAYALAFGAWGAPEMGVAGAAWGANIARVVGVAFLLGTLLMRSAPEGIRIGAGAPAGTTGWMPNIAIGRTFLTLSLPAVIDQLSFSGMFLILGRILLSMGPSVFAAQRIAMTAGSVSWLPAIGLQIAATALVGQAIGAKDYDRVAAVNRFAQQLAIGWMISAAVIFVVGAQHIAGFFTADPDIMAQAAWGLYSFAPGLPIAGIQFVLQGTLRGAGDTQFPMWNSIITQWLVILPCAWFLGHVLGFGIVGAFMGFMASSVVNVIALRWRFGTGIWRSKAVLSSENHAMTAI
jgi:putative MATE family efflux protein